MEVRRVFSAGLLFLFNCLIVPDHRAGSIRGKASAAKKYSGRFFCEMLDKGNGLCYNRYSGLTSGDDTALDISGGKAQIKMMMKEVSG